MALSIKNVPDVNRKGSRRLEYSSGDLLYMGVHSQHNASNDDDTWEITKFTYDSGDLVLMEVLTGSWTDRASLGWA